MKKRSQRQKELKQKLRRRKRRRIAVRVLSLLIALGILAGVGYWFYTATVQGVFNIKHVEVVGSGSRESQGIIDAAGVPMDQNLFTANLNAIDTNIRNNLMVDDLRVSKKYPDTILVDITLEPAVCAMVAEDKTFYLNKEGKVVEVSDYLEKSDIPLVSGLTGITVDTAVRSNATIQPEWKYKEILRMIDVLDNSGYGSKISEIIATSDNHYKIITKNNVIFQVDDFEGFKENYDYIGTVIQKNQSNLDINLTAGPNPIVKTR